MARGKRLFEVLSQVEAAEVGPRLGRLTIKERKPLDTPNFLAISSRGVVPHITPDVLSQHTQIGGVHMALEDFTEKATSGTAPIMNCPGSSPLHTFTCLPTSLTTLITPRRTPAVTAPNGNTDKAVSIFTSTGFHALENEAYIDYIQRLRPDIVVALADVAHGSIPGVKRVAKMGDRTCHWLKETLAAKDEDQAIFASILPIGISNQLEYLDRLADDLVDEIDGLALYDTNLLPDIPATTALAALPRLSLDEPASPHQILRQISLGMDVFNVPFIGFATDAGIALSFRFPNPLPEESGLVVDTGSSALPLGIDMWEKDHAISLAPLTAFCKCYACTSHHRAFIQHLLSAKEMLGWVLLQVHNHHVLFDFFAAIRKSIKDEGFTADCQAFARAYESELPEKSGQGPRVRGYHFKSEGSGEQKKNKAAWGTLGGDDQDVGAGLVPSEAAAGLEKKGVAEKVDQ